MEKLIDFEKTWKKSYELLHLDDVIRYMDADVQDIKDVFEYPEAVARNLLHRFRWDKQKLMEKLVEVDDFDRFCTSVCIANPFKPAVVNPLVVPCDKCSTSFPWQHRVELKCKHTFCKECFEADLKAEVVDKQNELISCPAVNCNIIMEQSIVAELLTEDLKLTYKHLVIDSFIEHNHELRRCPSSGCPWMMKMSKDSLKSSECTCKCGYRFCFDCGYESHLPASCELVKKFIVDAKVSSVRPKLGTDCQSVWEKFEKCNKKDCDDCLLCCCYTSSCRLICGNNERRWLDRILTTQLGTHDLMEIFRNHINRRFDCEDDRLFGFSKKSNNSFNSEAEAIAVDRKIQIDREKIDEHIKHLANRIAKQLRQETDYQEDVLCVWKKGIDMAFECWQTIKYSNIFEYYSFENAKKELIEGNLDNLKAATCELIRLIQEICVENIKDTHADLVTEIRRCQVQRLTLLDAIKEGFDNESWKFLE